MVTFDFGITNVYTPVETFVTGIDFPEASTTEITDAPLTSSVPIPVVTMFFALIVITSLAYALLLETVTFPFWSLEKLTSYLTVLEDQTSISTRSKIAVSF